MKRLMSILFVIGLMLFAVPARAADVVSTLPELRWPASGRFEFAIAFEGSALLVSQTRFVVGRTPQEDQYHSVTRNLARPEALEEIVVGGRSYSRLTAETRWKSRPYDPDQAFFNPRGEPLRMLPSGNATVIRVGDVNIAGAPTTQYQIPLDPKLTDVPTATAAKLDLFIGKNDGYLHKGQVTIRTPLEEGGPAGDFVYVYRVYDFNAPVVIGPPPADLIDAQAIRDTDRP